MKRKDIVTKLMKEGLSEKILATMSDKQLNMLSERLLSEQYTTTPMPSQGSAPVNVSKTDIKTIGTLKQQKKPFVTYEGQGAVAEELIAPKLGSEEKKPAEDKDLIIKRSNAKIKQALKDGKKYDDYIKAIKHVNGGKLPDSTQKIVNGNKEKKLDERHGGKSPTGVKTHTPKTDAGGTPKENEKPKSFADQRWNAPRRKGKLHENDKNLKEWVEEIVKKNVHPFTSKNEIMELIQMKMNEQTDSTIATDTEKKIPEFLTYDEIINAGSAEPITKPAPPVTKPGTKPGQPVKKPEKHNPYQPGPGINPGPKAVVRENKTSKK
jgi:hypothetical protein